MFEPMIKRAENAVGATITRLSGNAMAAVPLLLAFGFALAAAAYWANEELGPLFGNLAIAGVFLVVALLVYAYARRREAAQQARASAELAALTEASPMTAITRALQSSNVSQALYDLARNAAPTAAKTAAVSALRAAPRNLPLLLGAGLGLMVASRLVDAWTNGRRH
ncbi:hypothetical protein OGR47_02205 [Methylocystis sp. MJC1]|jgi:hypothetical protein|uniref:hypothetical protein n=2 Tax=Methylocystis sp. MJC1 TaxID=2654282 RepID=UPI001C1E3222|nr:hypothetical protein [Methylocystis sp. MJC1]KAF2990511.1 hypothetical protein MJC1_02273 [Methylocystis sp. MJC1]UZX12293.1 hypothetical protein OGR47_02205 [Methylocystis sp. MJC1]